MELAIILFVLFTLGLATSAVVAQEAKKFNCTWSFVGFVLIGTLMFVGASAALVRILSLM